MPRKSGDKDIAPRTYYGRETVNRNMPSLPSVITPLPWYASLRRVLRQHGAAVLLTYFEVFHLENQNVSLAQVQSELQITKRNWRWVANGISVRYPNQTHLKAAQKARREFVKDQKGIHGLVMPYSLTGLDDGPRNCLLRRNQTALDNLLQKAGLTASQIRSDAAKLTPVPLASEPDKRNATANSQPPAPLFSPSPLDAAEELCSEIDARIAAAKLRVDKQKL